MQTLTCGYCLFRDYSLRISEISFRLLTASRLRVIQQFDVSTTETQGIILKWKNTITGLTEIINSQNEKSMYIYLQLICESSLLKAEQVLEALKASVRISKFIPTQSFHCKCDKLIYFSLLSYIESDTSSFVTCQTTLVRINSHLAFCDQNYTRFSIGKSPRMYSATSAD